MMVKTCGQREDTLLQVSKTLNSISKRIDPITKGEIHGISALTWGKCIRN